MIFGKKSKFRSSVLETYSLYFVIAWTIIVGGFLLFGVFQIQHIQQEMIKNEARANFNKDQALRFWSATHGGVYVPVTDKTPPNPYLSHVKERDIKTPDGKALTLMNPAYMLRQTMEKYESLYGVRGHITSLQYFRPETAPDEWEKSALQEFERGAKEISEFTEIDGKLYYRYMSPMITKTGCLKCHGHQGYKVGDIRGGVSVSVPMTPYLINQQRQTITLAVSLGLLWLLGLTGFVLANRGIQQRVMERDRAESKLQKAHDALEHRVEERTAELTQEIEKRKSSEGKYRNIFENIQDIYYEASMEGTILEISPSTENIFEYKRKELIGKSLYDIYTNPEERNELLKAILDSGKVANFEVHLTDKDGSQHSVELNATLYRDQKGNPIKLIGSMRDISKRKRLEARLRQSQKMEAIGSLAGGIAHEFNNILGTIIGNTELAINYVPESNPAWNCLKEIQTASLRAKDVVRQILGFARKSVFQLVPVQISPIFSEILELIRASIPTTIEIRRNLSCKSDTVMADPTQISQVLMNLCINANNAMRGKGGVLEVKLEDTILDEKSATRYEDLSPGNYVKLVVKDSGHGIDPKIIDRIFDPYFTTTSLAEGSGMGLAVVHGIVKHHKGAITVASEPGKGTVFEVLFPLTKPEAEQKTREPKALPTGNEKILFVDDEASLVKMAKQWLEIQGYQVEAKNDPVEALELFRSRPDMFDLIITDMTMPKMTGDKLAKEILNIRPDMPIILCSGFSEKIDAEKAMELGIRKYVEKPLNMSDFVVAIRKVLDAENEK